MNDEQKRPGKDTVYATPFESVGDFRFDESVADVFTDMIERSVPGYGMVLQLIGLLAERYALEGTNTYDLGCSLGASTLQLRRHIPANCHVIGIDSSPAMVERCRSNISRDHSAATCEVLEQDIRDTDFNNASMIVLNFTLQFIDDDERQSILNRMYQGLNKGGIILLAEKVRFEDEGKQALMTELHHDFKKLQGYSDLEIAQKRAAIENVLIPNSEALHVSRLEQAGFSTVLRCMHCLNFSAFLGIK